MLTLISAAGESHEGGGQLLYREVAHWGGPQPVGDGCHGLCRPQRPRSPGLVFTALFFFLYVKCLQVDDARLEGDHERVEVDQDYIYGYNF